VNEKGKKKSQKKKSRSHTKTQKMSQYGQRSYWDDRYARDTEPFDWYQRYSGLQDILADRFKVKIIIYYFTSKRDK
jgi:hypothetical protein